MRIVADENVSGYLIYRLRVRGHSVSSISEILPGVKDEDVLAFALERDALLVTEDKGFGEMVFRDRLPTKGVLLLRFPDQHPLKVADYSAEIIHEYGETLIDKFAVLSSTNLRVHPI